METASQVDAKKATLKGLLLGPTSDLRASTLRSGCSGITCESSRLTTDR